MLAPRGYHHTRLAPDVVQEVGVVVYVLNLSPAYLLQLRRCQGRRVDRLNHAALVVFGSARLHVRNARKHAVSGADDLDQPPGVAPVPKRELRLLSVQMRIRIQAVDPHDVAGLEQRRINPSRSFVRNVGGLVRSSTDRDRSGARLLRQHRAEACPLPRCAAAARGCRWSCGGHPLQPVGGGLLRALSDLVAAGVEVRVEGDAARAGAGHLPHLVHGDFRQRRRDDLVGTAVREENLQVTL
mmetsp:Transcript_88499/g.275161  ORF Transcript_88499/g.275161 Transcript_88499/m.275161 type:complete len:241 (+) Transcript_88499:911-1633(+)